MKTFQQPLSAQEEACYLRMMNDGDSQAALEARRILIERNLRLVAHVAKKYAGAGEEMEDLISIGTIGLIKAITTFKQEKGSRLATYAAKCIENAILTQMRLWLETNLPRVKRNRNGVFWHMFPRICTYFAPPRTVM